MKYIQMAFTLVNYIYLLNCFLGSVWSFLFFFLSVNCTCNETPNGSAILDF